MKVILEKIWGEPAVAIGFVTTVALVVVNALHGTLDDAVTIITVLAPLVSSLGIRQTVTPAR